MLVVHTDDALLIDDSVEPPGQRIGDALYVAAPPIAKSAVIPADVSVGRALMEALSSWHFKEADARDVVIGAIGAGYLGAAKGWGGHVCQHGDRGVGKTKLSEIVAAALGAAPHPRLNDFSESGLRQRFSTSSRVLILDEAEGQNGRMRQVIELLRRLTDARGAVTVRGTAAGVSQSFELHRQAFLFCILSPALKPQDRSRITLLHLDRLDTGDTAAGRAEQVEAAIAMARTASPELWARAIENYPRFVATFRAYRNAFIADEAAPRMADQLATFAAGRDLLIEDSAPDGVRLAAIVAKFRPIIDAVDALDEGGEGTACLNHLLSGLLDSWRGGDRRTVSAVVLDARNQHDAPPNDEAHCLLALYGLKLIWDEMPNGPPIRKLLVANQHAGLERLFAGTRWRGGAWRGALHHLDGAHAWPLGGKGTVAKFAGTPIRATAIPSRWLPEPDDAPAANAEQTPTPKA